MFKRISGYAAAFIAGVVLAGGTAYAATNYVQAQKGSSQITINSEQVSTEPALVYGGTTYIPAWYLQNALRKMNVQNSWNGYTLNVINPWMGATGQTISSTLEHTEEGQYGGMFVPNWNTETTVSDGRGGVLTAIIGQATASFYGDGFGQAVFIFHNGDFVGYGSTNEQHWIPAISMSGNKIHVTYATYETGDAISKATGPNIETYYGWDGTKLYTTGGNPQETQGPALYYNHGW